MPTLAAYRKQPPYSLTNPPPPVSGGGEEMSVKDKFRRILADLNDIITDENLRDEETETELAIVKDMVTKLAKGESIKDMLFREIPRSTEVSYLPNQGNFAPPPPMSGIKPEDIVRISPGQYGAY